VSLWTLNHEFPIISHAMKYSCLIFINNHLNIKLVVRPTWIGSELDPACGSWFAGPAQSTGWLC
jgi:hypothetical protein